MEDPASPGVVDFSFGLVPFSVTLNGTDDSITFDQAYSSTFAIEDALEIFSSSPFTSGTVDLVIPDNTKWTVVGNSFGEPLMQVTSGSATVTGTGSFPSESLAAGECFNLRPSFGFPLVSTPSCIPQ